MAQNDNKDIIGIIGQIKCPKDFRCYRSGFDILCQAKKYGVESLLECLDEKPDKCLFSFHFGGTYFCKCPLRIYIAEHLSK